MIIYSNGCSHTADTKILYDKTYIDIIGDVILKTYNDINPTEGYYGDNKNFHFDKLDKESNYLIKHAEHGKSNDLIFFETYNIILNSLKTIKIDYAIIQLSGVNRRLHSMPDGSLKNVNPFDNFELGVKFEPFATEQSLQYILILQDLFKKNNINYCFIPYMEFDSDVLNKSDIMSFIDFGKFTTDLYNGHRNFFRLNGLSRDAPGHPNSIGYYEMAKMCLTILSDSYKIDSISNYYPSNILLNDTNSKEREFVMGVGNLLGDGTEEDVEKNR